MVKVIWFKNSHEQRLNWLKFGLMQLHIQKKIVFLEKDSKTLSGESISDAAKQHTHKHTVLIKVIKKGEAKWVMADAEDSFFFVQPLIKDVDLYFCSAYNTDFFVNKKFEYKLPWQSDKDIKEYKAIANDLIDKYGSHFHKARRLAPISPSLFPATPSKGALSQKISNIVYKIHQILFGSNSWGDAYDLFDKRYQELLGYRHQPLQYDIVLHDSLWGWPQHRINLHKRLKGLAGEFSILSELKYAPDGYVKEFNAEDFPMVTQPIAGNYEQKIVASKLGVFATGFHFGWRNIVLLALMAGIPVYTDYIILEPYFDFNEFQLFYNNNEFNDLKEILLSINEKSWQDIKTHNQQMFDKYMHPAKVAAYFVDTV
ncbi:hypothetical protein [Parasediminibacterium sp. JCM 36343]|uniref:hypothetical protein n=1 Tax=Parasediminibacterium sp. JCM 36343 TaxID=3374279 RepID=UPI00397E5DC4